MMYSGTKNSLTTELKQTKVIYFKQIVNLSQIVWKSSVQVFKTDASYDTRIHLEF